MLSLALTRVAIPSPCYLGRGAAMLTAASMESNASGVLLVSNPLAHRSAAGGSDIFLNPLVSHRSSLHPNGSQNLRSHPLAELTPGGYDALLFALSTILNAQTAGLCLPTNTLPPPL